MDAISMDLTEQVDYKSTAPGLAHGCGHDVHTTIGLGVARVLASLRDRFDGTAVFIFQPAEETGQGARRMIDEGALKDPAPDAIFALHVAPMPVGTITTTPGTGLAGVDVFTIRLESGAEIAAAAQELAAVIRNANNVVQGNLSAILGGMFEPDNPTLSTFVMTSAQIRTEGGVQVVSGLVRAARESDQARVMNDVRAKLKELEGRGITARMESSMSLPAMTSDPDLGVWAMGPLESILGKSSVLRVYHAIPTNSEDFAFFLQKVPGVMFWLGGSNDATGAMALPHAPTFTIDERAIGAGIKGMSQVMIQRLAEEAR
jgi:amidohydrolase